MMLVTAAVKFLENCNEKLLVTITTFGFMLINQYQYQYIKVHSKTDG